MSQLSKAMNKLRIGLCALLLLGSAARLAAQCPADTPLPLRPLLTCQPGQDTTGAFFLIAKPANYNGRLVLWNHGYDLAPPGPRSFNDLSPAAPILLTQGYAVAASSYRPDPIGLGGWAVADGAEDTENLRQAFVRMFGQPNMTLVMGASEGGLVTATIAEKFGWADDGTIQYHGVLPLCGPLAGGCWNWYGGFDLRVVYQFYCQNLPRSNEMQYALQFGLAPGNTLPLTAPAGMDSVVARINDCTGILLPPAVRTAQQKQNLANILNVTKVPESFLLTDMGFATFALQELVLVRTRGGSPVTNLGVVYSGSTDDDALNSGVYRAGSNPDAVAFLTNAYDPTGNETAVGTGTFAYSSRNSLSTGDADIRGARFPRAVHLTAHDGHVDILVAERDHPLFHFLGQAY